jgi:hypothetical protein
VIRTVGERRTEDNLKSHVDLVEMLDFVNLEKGLSIFNCLTDRYMFSDGHISVT